jgi:hypothetical protein
MLSIADAILQEDIHTVRQILQYGVDINAIDEYGFTPLIETAIIDNVELTQLILSNGADANKQDATGGTALQWAAENNNYAMCKLLLEKRADPNAYNFSGQPVLVMPMLRRQSKLRQLLVSAGADLAFAQDYINTKLLGHMFELIGMSDIVDPKNQYVDVDFEGFYLEVTIGLISESLSQFQNHFAARQLKRYAGLVQYIIETMQRTSELTRYQQYRVDINKHEAKIDAILREEPVLLPVGYEGHAITFIKRGDVWVKCDRREDSRLYDNVMFYRIGNMQNATPEFIKDLIYKKHDSDYINNGIDRILGLEPITELKIEAQISGNCSWANVEACMPALFFLVLMQISQDSKALSHYKSLALNYFHRWREWNKDRALHYCIQSYKEGDAVRKACKAEILAAILFQRCKANDPKESERIDLILAVLLKSPYEYILENYLRVYYFESYSEEGKQFYELLKERGYKAK